MRNPFKKKENKVEEKEEIIELGSGRVWSKSKIEQILRDETPSQLRIRVETITKVLIKDKPLAGESVEETIARKRPLKELKEQIIKVIMEKEAKMKISQDENTQEWVRTEVSKRLTATRPLRYAYGARVDGLRSGLHRLSHVDWLPVTDKIITIKTQSGRTLSFNLLEKIHPIHWKQIFEAPLVPKFFNVERGVVGVDKDGKAVTGYWASGMDFEKTSKIKPVIFSTHIAIMSV